MFAGCTTEFRRLRPGRPTAFFAALVVFIIVILVAAPQAQQRASFAPSRPGGAGVTKEAAGELTTDIDLLVGRSTILNLGSAITRVSLTVPDIADAMVTTPTQLLIHGKAPGTISMFVWDRSGTIRSFEVTVRRDLSRLIEQVKQLFPGEPITVAGSGKDVVLSGTVSGQYVIDKAGDVAAGYVDKKENIVNLLKQQEGVASNQVLLRVRFAEVSRNALQQLGASMFSDGKNNYFGRTTTQQFAAPFFDKNKANLGDTLVFNDYLNLFLFDAKNHLGALIKALQTKGVFQSLAEPNLVALNGKEASFLAGGEFPYPVVQGAAGTNSVTIVFKEFGIRLSFTPTVLAGDLVNLKLRPEVSSLDFSNGVTMEGFRIPALSTRRADTEVELRDGQTFAIAGLLNNTAVSTMSKVPGIGDIPILGNLFRSRSYQKDQTELVVMVTPTILRRDSTGTSEALPSLVEPYLGAPPKPLAPPAPYTGSPRYPTKGQNPGQRPQPVPGPQPEPQAMAPETPNAARGQQATSGSQSAVVKPLDPEKPIASRPVATQPQQLAQPAQAADTGAPLGRPLTKDERKMLDRAREEERRAAGDAERARQDQARKDAETARVAAIEAERQKVEQAKLDAEQARKDAELKRQQDKLDKERADREAIVARKNAETAKKKAEQDRKRERALADAATRLKQAQAEYQAELEKAKGGSDDKTKDHGKTAPAPAPRN